MHCSFARPKDDGVFVSTDGIQWNYIGDLPFADEKNISFYYSNLEDMTFYNGYYYIISGSFIFRSKDLNIWEKESKYNGLDEKIAYSDKILIATTKNNFIKLSFDGGNSWINKTVGIYDDSNWIGNIVSYRNNFFVIYENGDIYKSYNGFEWEKFTRTDYRNNDDAFFFIDDKLITYSGNKIAFMQMPLIDQYYEEANQLKELGLFNGTSNGFELGRAPTRVEAAVMLIRLLGKENEVISGTYNHPFRDVPIWADKYIGYMYENNLTKGIGNNSYGSDLLMDAKSYTTLILRALGYNNSLNEFRWDTAIDKAMEIRLLSKVYAEYLKGDVFLRDDMVGISYAALMNILNGTDLTLIEKLINDNVITKNIIMNPTLHSLEIISDNSPMNDITPEVKQRLISYTYSFGLQENWDKVIEQDPNINNSSDMSKYIVDTLFDEILFDENEKYYTDENLAYVTRESINGQYCYGIRGVLQTINADKTITEIDIELIYYYSNAWQEYGYVGVFFLSEPITKNN